MTELTRANYLRYREEALLYDYDLFRKQVLLRIRLIIEDNTNGIITPIPFRYERRFQNVRPRSVAPKPPQLEPRNLSLCYEDQEEEQEINRTVYNPYVPSSWEHKQLINELKQGGYGFETIRYKGEVYNSSYEDLMND